jgi:hypothetical protein
MIGTNDYCRLIKYYRREDVRDLLEMLSLFGTEAEGIVVSSELNSSYIQTNIKRRIESCGTYVKQILGSGTWFYYGITKLKEQDENEGTIEIQKESTF